MKSVQGFRFKIFMPLFLLLMAVSAISSAAATAALGAGHSAIPSTALAILTSLAVCALGEPDYFGGNREREPHPCNVDRVSS